MTILPPGGLADVWFQLCLGEVLRQERPLRFEQDAAPPAFALLDELADAPVPAQAFARAARGSPSFAGTLYAAALRRELSREPARLVGSPALALAILGPSGASFDFAAADELARASIRAAAEMLAPGAAVRCSIQGAEVRGHGPADLCVFAPLGPAPDLSIERLAPFLELARSGGRVLELVAYGAPLAPAAEGAREELDALVDALSAELPATRLWCGELRPTDPDPAAPGCALLAANLAPAASATCRELAIRLAHALSSDDEARLDHGSLVYRER